MHKAKNVIISCIDFRFQKALQNHLNSQGYLGKTDEIIVAGASRDFIKPLEEKDRDYLFQQLNLSIKSHEPEIIIICGHQDCGGWAQDKTISSELTREEDLELHEKYWRLLKSVLKEKFPHKEIEFWYIDLKMKVEKIEV